MTQRPANFPFETLAKIEITRRVDPPSWCGEAQLRHKVRKFGAAFAHRPCRAHATRRLPPPRVKKNASTRKTRKLFCQSLNILSERAVLLELACTYRLRSKRISTRPG